MDILDKIVAYKREEVAVRKLLTPVAELKQTVFFKRPSLSLKENLLKENSTGIIAEFKRKSPSKGYINRHADVLKITKAYASHGASGLSILTDNNFFGGHTQDLIEARVNDIPILRKDFIIDPYQLLAAKAMGADVVLLIAACLSVEEVKDLAAFAKQIGLETLLELHDENELHHICADIDMVGINNRNLKTFEVDINRSLELSTLIPPDKLKIAESGIIKPETIELFKAAGYKGFLVGETFMKETDPGQAFKNFITALK